ncbi:MAG: hypothetical protein JO317_09445 [Verrucomicrobiae bacterium]|nr:hypothetical protein [Verrucomicrobiae bacterium]
MKSAYELAMERLKKSDPDAGRPLTADQKERIADLDSLYKSKIAEKEILMKPKIAQARRAGDLDAANEAERLLAAEFGKLREECEREKQKIRDEPSAGKKSR